MIDSCEQALQILDRARHVLSEFAEDGDLLRRRRGGGSDLDVYRDDAIHPFSPRALPQRRLCSSEYARAAGSRFAPYERRTSSQLPDHIEALASVC